MIAEKDKKIIRYAVMCVHEFGSRFELDDLSAFRYLKANGGLQFLLEQYEIEHTLGLDAAIEDMQYVCKKNGGLI
ncbi:MAG: DUF3791 domain-containing protein [Chitinispirillales bacterium]|jgi:hypothetical protein|nr:DUF3791 domain-containing protein [Chitinispirillales bacterium]